MGWGLKSDCNLTYAQPAAVGRDRGRGRIQLSGGGVGSGKFRFRVGPQELQDIHPKYTAHIHDNVVHPPLRLFWTMGPTTTSLTFTLPRWQGNPGHTWLHHGEVPGHTRLRSPPNENKRNPPLCFDELVKITPRLTFISAR